MGKINFKIINFGRNLQYANIAICNSRNNGIDVGTVPSTVPLPRVTLVPCGLSHVFNSMKTIANCSKWPSNFPTTFDGLVHRRKRQALALDHPIVVDRVAPTCPTSGVESVPILRHCSSMLPVP